MLSSPTTSRIRVSCLLACGESLPEIDLSRALPQPVCSVSDSKNPGIRMDVRSILNREGDSFSDIRLPGFRSTIPTADAEACQIQLPAILESSTSSQAFEPCVRQGSPTNSSSSCATEAHWSRRSKTESSTASSNSSNSASCDDKVRNRSVFLACSLRPTRRYLQDEDEEDGGADSAPESSDAHPIFTGVSRYVCAALARSRAAVVLSECQRALPFKPHPARGNGAAARFCAQVRRAWPVARPALDPRPHHPPRHLRHRRGGRPVSRRRPPLLSDHDPRSRRR